MLTQLKVENDWLAALLDAQPYLATTANEHGWTPLHWAARNGHVPASDLLLQRGGDIDAMDRVGMPPVLYAAYWDAHKGVESSYASGVRASPGATSRTRASTPTTWAAAA